MKRAILLTVAAFFLGAGFTGCASIDRFLYKELKETDRAILEAQAAGKAQECPEAFNEVVALRDEAEKTYWGCQTDKAIEMAQEARQIADALCPPPPVGDSDGDGVTDDMDQCPGTPQGVTVDAAGCPLDLDGDGVPDYLDHCPATPANVEVDAVGCPLDSDGDGVPDYKDQCPGTPVGVKVNAMGCPMDADNDGVLDDVDECPKSPRGAKVDKKGCWKIEYIYFDFDKWNIKPIYYPILNDVLKVLKWNPTLKIEIQGNTCKIGGTKYNLQLAEKRAKQVLKYFVDKGVARDQLSALSAGDTNPVASNATKEGRIKNRRVEMHPNQR